MQKFTVLTSKGSITTTDLETAVNILLTDIEYQREKKAQPEKAQDWDTEFKKLLEKYTPKNKEDLLKKKFGGEE